MSVLRAEEQAEFDSCRNRRMLGGMLHFILSILLGILKIIGILLLTVLVLLLLVLSAILFAPVRYHLRVEKTEEALEGMAEISWLHVIRARLSADGRRRTHVLDIRIFGISPAKLRERLRRRKQKKKQQKGKQDTKKQAPNEINRTNKTDKANKTTTESPDGQAEADRNKQRNICRQEQPSEKDINEPEEAPQTTSSEETNSRPKEKILARILEMIQMLPYKIRAFCATIKSNVERIRELGKHMKRMGERIWSRLRQAAEIPEKIQQLLDFVEDYHLKELFAEGKAELNGLWRHYRPHKATGYLQFGTGDPALTGELTGVLYLLLPAFSEVQIEPDFNVLMLQTELELSGHIRACHLVATAWRLFRNKKLRRLITKIRKKGD